MSDVEQRRRLWNVPCCISRENITPTTCSAQLIRLDQFLGPLHKEQPQIYLPRHGTAPLNDAIPMSNVFTQTSPALGISFCLITVRLGTTTPEIRKDSWGSSQRIRVSRMLPVSDPQNSGLVTPTAPGEK